MRQAKLGEFLARRSRGIVPASTPDERFELYSVPAFECRRPEVVTGGQIGSNKQVVEPGTVLLCKINPRINRAWTVGSFTQHQKIASTEWITFPPHHDLEPRYLAHYLSRKEIRHYLAANASGVGGSLMRVKASAVEDLPLPLPSVDEQRRIVAEIEKQFSRLDEAVANLKRVKANLKRYKTTVLKSAVEGRLVPTEAELARRESRSYENGAAFLQRLIDTRRTNSNGKAKYNEPRSPGIAHMPGLPEGWTWAMLPQLGELGRGKSKHRPRDDPKLYGGPHPFIQTGDVRRSGGVIRDSTKFYSDFGLAQSHLWPQGTLCITIAANIAETGVLAMPACFPDSVVGFVSENEVLTQFIEYFMRTSRENLARFAPATAQKNINLATLESIVVPLPPLAEQRRISTELESRLSVVTEVDKELDVAMNRSQGLRFATLAESFSFESKEATP